MYTFTIALSRQNTSIANLADFQRGHEETLKKYAANWKAADSSLDVVTAFFFFNLPNPSSRTKTWGLLSL
jgi:hypothetical protein